MPNSPPVLLTSGQNITYQETYNTAVISPAGDGIIIAGIRTNHSLTVPVLSGCGLTWTLVRQLQFFFDYEHLFIYKGVGTPTSGAISIQVPGANSPTCLWQIIECPGASEVIQSASQVGSVTYPNITHQFPPATVALNAFDKANNGVVAVVSGYGSSSFTQKAGYTLVNVVGQTSGYGSMGMEWYGSQDTSPGWSAQSGLLNGYDDAWGGIALELDYAIPVNLSGDILFSPLSVSGVLSVPDASIFGDVLLSGMVVSGRLIKSLSTLALSGRRSRSIQLGGNSSPNIPLEGRYSRSINLRGRD